MTSKTEKQLPANLDAERAIIGAVLLDNMAYVEAVEAINPEDFYLDSHRRIWCRMIELAETGGAIDLITLVDVLGRHKEVEAVGGAAYISSLTDGVPRRDSIKAYLQIVKSKAQKRRLVRACDTTIAQVLEDEQSAEVCLADLETDIMGIRVTERAAMVSVKEAMPAVLNEIATMWDWTGDVIGLTTGVRSIDQSTTGIRKQETWVIGARPARGKTAWASQILRENAKVGVPGLCFSLEMGQSSLIRRLLVQHGATTAQRMRDPRWMDKREREDIPAIGAEVAELPIYIDDTAGLHVRQMMARAKLAIRRHGVRLIVVDYLQLIEAPGKDPLAKCSYAIRALRDMAKSEDVALIVLSQLARSPNENDRPTLSKLKETGSIEECADTVAFIYRPLEHGTWTNEDEIIIAKQRNGPVGSERVVYLDQKFSFGEREA